MKKVLAYTLASAAILLPTAVFAAPTINTAAANIQTTLQVLTQIINYILIFLDALAVLVFVYGLIRYLMQAGNEDARKEARSYMIWGIVIFVVIASLYGIINVVVNTFGLTGGTQIPAPQVNPPTP